MKHIQIHPVNNGFLVSTDIEEHYVCKTWQDVLDILVVIGIEKEFVKVWQ